MVVKDISVLVVDIDVRPAPYTENDVRFGVNRVPAIDAPPFTVKSVLDTGVVVPIQRVPLLLNRASSVLYALKMMSWLGLDIIYNGPDVDSIAAGYFNATGVTRAEPGIFVRPAPLPINSPDVVILPFADIVDELVMVDVDIKEDAVTVPLKVVEFCTDGNALLVIPVIPEPLPVKDPAVIAPVAVMLVNVGLEGIVMLHSPLPSPTNDVAVTVPAKVVDFCIIGRALLLMFVIFEPLPIKEPAVTVPIVVIEPAVILAKDGFDGIEIFVIPLPSPTNDVAVTVPANVVDFCTKGRALLLMFVIILPSPANAVAYTVFDE